MAPDFPYTQSKTYSVPSDQAILVNCWPGNESPKPNIPPNLLQELKSAATKKQLKQRNRISGSGEAPAAIIIKGRTKSRPADRGTPKAKRPQQKSKTPQEQVEGLSISIGDHVNVPDGVLQQVLANFKAGQQSQVDSSIGSGGHKASSGSAVNWSSVKASHHRQGDEAHTPTRAVQSIRERNTRPRNEMLENRVEKGNGQVEEAEESEESEESESDKGTPLTWSATPSRRPASQAPTSTPTPTPRLQPPWVPLPLNSTRVPRNLPFPIPPSSADSETDELQIDYPAAIAAPTNGVNIAPTQYTHPPAAQPPAAQRSSGFLQCAQREPSTCPSPTPSDSRQEIVGEMAPPKMARRRMQPIVFEERSTSSSPTSAKSRPASAGSSVRSFGGGKKRKRDDADDNFSPFQENPRDVRRGSLFTTRHMEPRGPSKVSYNNFRDHYFNQYASNNQHRLRDFLRACITLYEKVKKYPLAIPDDYMDTYIIRFQDWATYVHEEDSKGAKPKDMVDWFWRKVRALEKPCLPPYDRKMLGAHNLFSVFESHPREYEEIMAEGKERSLEAAAAQPIEAEKLADTGSQSVATQTPTSEEPVPALGEHKVLPIMANNETQTVIETRHHPMIDMLTQTVEDVTVQATMDEGTQTDARNRAMNDRPTQTAEGVRVEATMEVGIQTDALEAMMDEAIQTDARMEVHAVMDTNTQTVAEQPSPEAARVQPSLLVKDSLAPHPNQTQVLDQDPASSRHDPNPSRAFPASGFPAIVAAKEHWTAQAVKDRKYEEVSTVTSKATTTLVLPAASSTRVSRSPPPPPRASVELLSARSARSSIAPSNVQSERPAAVPSAGNVDPQTPRRVFRSWNVGGAATTARRSAVDSHNRIMAEARRRLRSAPRSSLTSSAVASARRETDSVIFYSSGSSRVLEAKPSPAPKAAPPDPPSTAAPVGSPDEESESLRAGSPDLSTDFGGKDEDEGGTSAGIPVSSPSLLPHAGPPPSPSSSTPSSVALNQTFPGPPPPDDPMMRARWAIDRDREIRRQQKKLKKEKRAKKRAEKTKGTGAQGSK